MGSTSMGQGPLKYLSASILAAGLAMGMFTTAEAAKITRPKAVLELFTSQGCSSCPPADRLVGKFSENNEILAISTHVDYWDYLGWKDSFASKANTERQYAYARSMRESQVYTPQAVINGRLHVVGSREDRIMGAVENLQDSGHGMIVPINVKSDANSLTININDHPAAKDATVFILSLSTEETVGIARGENAGAQIMYHNVLKDRQPVGMVKAGGLEMNFPLSELKKSGVDCFAVLLQNTDRSGNPTEIVGAILIEDL